MRTPITLGRTIYSIHLHESVYKELLKLDKIAGVKRADWIREAIFEKMAREKSKYKFTSVDLNPFNNDYITIKKSDLNELVLRTLLQLKKKSK